MAEAPAVDIAEAVVVTVEVGVMVVAVAADIVEEAEEVVAGAAVDRMARLVEAGVRVRPQAAGVGAAHRQVLRAEGDAAEE